MKMGFFMALALLVIVAFSPIGNSHAPPLTDLMVMTADDSPTMVTAVTADIALGEATSEAYYQYGITQTAETPSLLAPTSALRHESFYMTTLRGDRYNYSGNMYAIRSRAPSLRPPDLYWAPMTI